MSCIILHRQAIFTLLAVLTLHSPFKTFLRRYIVSFTDAIDWAPQLVKDPHYVMITGDLSAYLPPLGWQWPKGYVADARWYLFPREIDDTRRRLVKITH